MLLYVCVEYIHWYWNDYHLSSWFFRRLAVARRGHPWHKQWNTVHQKIQNTSCAPHLEKETRENNERPWKKKKALHRGIVHINESVCVCVCVCVCKCVCVCVCVYLHKGTFPCLEIERKWVTLQSRPCHSAWRPPAPAMSEVICWSVCVCVCVCVCVKVIPMVWEYFSQKKTHTHAAADTHATTQ